jgi:undecaprenyl-diphosphatase
MNLLIIIVAKYLYLLSILTAVGWIYLKAKRQTGNVSKLILVSFPIAYIIAKILSHFYYNARPFVTENIKPLINHASNNGFPSDHTLLTMTIAAVVYQYNRKFGALLAFLAILIGYARIAAKIHYQIDIWSAVVIAIFAVYSSVRILKRFGVVIAK